MKREILLLTMLLFVFFAHAQNKNVSGKVTSSGDGQPIPGVSVLLKGTTTGTQTDVDGNYKISVPEGAGTLQFRSIGFLDKEEVIGNRSVINVVMDSDERQLSEVVVTANAIQRESRTLGYSVSTVKAEELTRGQDRSVLNSMQGKVAGVQISNASGSPGSSTRVVIRGGTSLQGNNQALVVVDGTPIDNSSPETGDNLNNQVDAGNRVNDINPEDIESISVLKGPAAAALYGSRASNGALIITTKSGKGLGKGKTQVTLNSSYSFENILRLPDFQNDYGQGGQGAPDLIENFSWGPRFDGLVRPWGQVINGQQQVKPYLGLEDNVKDFFDLGQTWNNTVSISQGGEQAAYYLSFGNVDQKGVMPGTNYDRISIKVSASADLSKKFYSNASVNYVRSQGDLSVQGQSNSPYDQVVQTPRDISLVDLEDYTNNPFNTLSGYYGAFTVNPWYLLGEDYYKNTVDRVYGNVAIGFKPVEWIDLLARVGTDVSGDKRRQATSKRIYTDPLEQNADNADDGMYEETSINVREFNLDLMATFKRDLTPDINMTAIAGFNNRQRNVTQQISTAGALVIPGLYNLANVDGVPSATNTELVRRLVGAYVSLNFGYKNYAFLELTGRNDWSSTLPKGNNSYFYPSANASLIFTDALGMENDILTYGKFRIGYAKVGNDADPYLLQTVFNQGFIDDGFQDSEIRYPLIGVPGFEVGNLIGNSDLKPEITTSFEVGVDLGFWQDRLGLEATYYSNESKDQIIPVAVSPGSGFTTKVINAGLLTNKGVELLVRGRPISTPSGFKWDLTWTYTKNNSKVEELYGGVQQVNVVPPGISSGLNGMAMVAQVGQPYGAFFGNDNLRDPQGRVVVDPTTGYPLADPNARILGNIQPKYLMGFSTEFNYKGFTLTGVLDVKEGGTIYSRTKSVMEFVGTDPETLYNNREPFVIPNSVIQQDDGSFIENTVPVLNAQDYWTTFRSNADALLDASYVKLREVSLSYQFPSKMFKNSPVSGLQVGFIGRNLAIWTPDENHYIDPEASSFGNGNIQGYDFSTIPSLRSYGLNLRVTF